MTELDDTALVLEVGSGSHPWHRSDVLLDRFYVDETGQRGGGEIFIDRRPMVVAAGERLPFKDKAFDFVYSCHVIEHAEDIASMLNEMSRVGKAGFIECPNPLLEKVLDQAQHNWYITNASGKLLIARKTQDNNITTKVERFYFRMMSDHLILRHNWENFVTRLYWKDSISFEIVPDVNQVLDAQNIDLDIEEKVQRRLLHVLRKAWVDAVRDRTFSLILNRTTLRNVLKRTRSVVQRFNQRRQRVRVNKERLLSLLACPHCRADLCREREKYLCLGCSREFPDTDTVSVLL